MLTAEQAHAVAAAGAPLTPPEPTPRGPAPLSLPRRLAVAASLVALLAGFIALVVIFQPFADAAGGCGGG